MINLTTARFRFKDSNWTLLKKSVTVEFKTLDANGTSQLESFYDAKERIHVIENIPIGVYKIVAKSDELMSDSIEVDIRNGGHVEEVFLLDEGSNFLRIGKRKIPILADTSKRGVLFSKELTEEEEKQFAAFVGNKGKMSNRGKSNRRQRVIQFGKGRSKAQRNKDERSISEHEFVQAIGPVIQDSEEEFVFLTGLVLIKSTAEEGDLGDKLKQLSFDLLGPISTANSLYLTKFSGDGTMGLIEQLKALEQIIETMVPFAPFYTSTTAVQPVGNMSGFQWHLDVLELPEVWQILETDLGMHSKFGSSEVTIGIFDSGIEITKVPPSGGNQGYINAVHPDFSGNVTDPSGNNIKKTYFAYDYNDSHVGQGNIPSGSKPGHGTSSAGIITAKPTTLGVSGVIPNSRLISMVSTNFGNFFGLLQGYQHASGLEPNWTNTGYFDPGHLFPENFSAVGQQVEALPAELDDYKIDGPAASVISNSISISGGALSVAAEEAINSLYGSIGYLGRKRRGCVLVYSTGNKDDKYKESTILGSERNVIMVGASTLDHLGRETKAPYSNYSENYDSLVDVCAPSASGTNHSGFYEPFARMVVTSSLTTNGIWTSTQYSSNIISASANNGTFTIGGTYTGSTVVHIIDGDKSEILVGTLSNDGTKTTVDITQNFTRAGYDKLRYSHSGGKDVKLLQNTNHKFTLFGGTSAAAPMVSGIIGLMLSVNPNLSWLEVRRILRSTAIPINLRHRGVVGTAWTSNLDWREFNPDPTKRYNYVDAHAIVNAQGAFVAKHIFKKIVDKLVDGEVKQVAEYEIKHSEPFEVVGGLLDSANTTINVGNITGYKPRQSILIGWESVLKSDVAIGALSIHVEDGRGFKDGQAIRIGRYAETSLLHVDGVNIDVNSTDGFEIDDEILINGTVYKIENFGTAASSSDDMGDGGSGSRIVLKPVPALGAIASPIGLLVKMAPSMYEDVTLVAMNAVTFDNGAGPNDDAPRPATLALSTALQNGYVAPVIVKDSTSEILSIVKTITPDTIKVDKPEYVHNGDFYVTKGFVADYNHGFGFGRINALRAVEAAKNYDYADVDLYLRSYDGDTGKTVNSAESIHSPDIMIRKQSDLDENSENSSENLHQNTEFIVPRVIDFEGTGTDDLEVDTYYTGNVTSITTYYIRIESANQYSYLKVDGSMSTPSVANINIPNAFADIENGATGLRIKFGAGPHDIGDEWTIEVRPQKRHIYARVWNSGKLDSDSNSNAAIAQDVNNVRFSLCVKGDKNLLLENFVMNNKNTPFSLSSGQEGSKILNGSEQNFKKPIKGRINEVGVDTGEHHRFFRHEWLDSNLPPRNKFDGGNTAQAALFGSKRLFVLAEVLPHDGIVMDGANVSDGLSPHKNNNISFREVGFYNATFRKAGNAGVPTFFMELDNAALPETVSIDLKALVGVFYKRNIKVVFTRELFNSGDSEVAEWHYNSGTMAFEFQDPNIPDTTYDSAWITTPPNIAGDVNTAEIQTVFETTVEASLNTAKISIAVEVMNEEGEWSLYKEAHQIIVAAPGNIPAESTTGTLGTTKNQKVLFYTEPDLLGDLAGGSPQTASMAFGPLGTTDIDFNTTNQFKTTGATNPLAFAVTDGVIFAQETTNGPSGTDATVNLILKPYDQGAIQGLKIKYFVYRGILMSELVDNNGTDLNVNSVGTIDLVKNAVESYETLYKKVNNVNSVPAGEVVGIESLGLDLGSLPDSTPLLAGFVGRLDNQPVPVKKGETLGHFHGMAGANLIGFDIILDDSNLEPTLGDVRLDQNIVSYQVSGASREAELTARSKVLGYLDPCAFYGMHAIGGTVDVNLHSGGNPTLETYEAGENNVYKKLLAPYFLNKNHIYLDIRGAQDKTYNFSGVIPDDQIGFVLGPSGNPALKDYLTESWPIMILTSNDLVPDNSAVKKEVLKFQVAPKGGMNSSFKMFISSGKPFQSKMKRLVKPVKEKKRFEKVNTDASGLAEGPIDLAIVNYPPDLTNPVTSMVSYYFRLKYTDNLAVAPADQGSLMPKNFEFDNIFGPEPEFFANSKNTQMMSVGRESYLDAGGSFGFQGMIDVGMAKEPGRTTYFGVPKVTESNLRGSTQFKKLIGGSFDQSFLDVNLGNKLPGLKKRKREITIGGNTINYLDVVSDEIIGNELSSPLNLMGISMTDTEIATLKTNIANLDETIYSPTLNIRSKTTGLDDNGLGYLKVEVGFAGLDSSGTFTELPETLEVYGSSGTFLCSSAAAAMDPDPVVETWGDITWDKNNSGNPQVYRRLIVDVDRENFVNHKLEWELYDEQGNVQTYTGTPEDTWGRTGIANAGDPVLLPAGTRVVVMGRRLLGNNVNYKGNYTFYRVLCWYRNEYREGYVAEYSVLFQRGEDRVNVEDLKYMSDLAVVETFFSDIAFDLKIAEDLGVAINASSTAPKYWGQVQQIKTRWQLLRFNVQTLGNILMPSYREEIELLATPENNKFATNRRTMQADLRRFKNFDMFNAMEEYDTYLVFSLDPHGEVFKELSSAGAETYPLLSETVVNSAIGEYKGNESLSSSSFEHDPVDNNIQVLKQELTDLKAAIDASSAVTDPIRTSADYVFIEEILDAGNVSNPNIITVHEADTLIFLGANGWKTSIERQNRYLNSLVPSDQSFGHVDSSTLFSLMVNESNITYAFVPPSYDTWTALFNMVTDTHDEGALAAYSYMKDPTHTMPSLLAMNGYLNVDPNASSLAHVIRRLFLRNPEIALFYMDEYLKEFGV